MAEKNVSVDVSGLLNQATEAVATLQSQRQSFLDSVNLIDTQLAQLEGMTGASASTGKRGRPKGSTNHRVGRPAGRAKNESGLADALLSVLGKSPMGLDTIVEAVQASGYKSTSDNFKTIVNQALARLMKDKAVGRPSRGQYVKISTPRNAKKVSRKAKTVQAA